MPEAIPLTGKPEDNKIKNDAADASSANWQTRVLRPDDNAPLSRLDPGEAAAIPAALSPTINLRVEKTPHEFAHLYAALERQVAGIADVTLLSDETLGSQNPYVLGISSAVAGEGKTTTALHLAMTIARNTFKRVCLIDMSLGEGDLGIRMGIATAGEGMVSVLEETDNVVPTLQLAECDNLVIIPAGRLPKNPAKLARSPRVAQMLISARHSFEIVIVDLPAVSTDNALPLARHVDGILLVARSGATPSDVITQAIDTLGRDKVIGVTLNRFKSPSPKWLQKKFSKV